MFLTSHAAHPRLSFLLRMCLFGLNGKAPCRVEVVCVAICCAALAWGITSAQLMPMALPNNPTDLERHSHRADAPIPRTVFDALVEEARAMDVRVYVHANQRDAARMAIPAGVSAFHHGTMDAEFVSEDWRRMQVAGTAWAPTLHAILFFGDQRRYARRLLAEPGFDAAMSQEELAQLLVSP